MWRVRRAHRPQAVAGEVVGREGVEALEVVEVVVGLRMNSEDEHESGNFHL